MSFEHKTRNEIRCEQVGNVVTLVFEADSKERADGLYKTFSDQLARGFINITVSGLKPQMTETNLQKQ